MMSPEHTNTLVSRKRIILTQLCSLVAGEIIHFFGLKAAQLCWRPGLTITSSLSGKLMLGNEPF